MTLAFATHHHAGTVGIIDRRLSAPGSWLAVPGGIAHRTIHPVHRTPAILRLYHRHALPPAETLEGFLRRAQAASTLRHPGLLVPIAAGISGDQVFAVLPNQAGTPLSDRVRQHGPITAAEAGELLRQAAEALHAAHIAGLMHGGLQPDCLLGTEPALPTHGARCLITNLGLIPRWPKLSDWSANGSAAVGEALGMNLAFLPPERLHDGTPTVAGDLYGLGATFYFLFSGQPPYQAASTPELLQALACAHPKPLADIRPDLPASVVAMVERLMAREPSARPATAAEVASSVATRAAPLATPAHQPTEPDHEVREPDHELAPAHQLSLTAHEVTEPEHDLAPAHQPTEHDHDLAGPDQELVEPVHELTEPAHDLNFTGWQSADAQEDAFHGMQSGTAAGTTAADAAAKLPAPANTPLSDAERRRLRFWLILGGIFWLVLAPLLWIILLSENGCFSPPAEPINSPHRR